MKILVVDDEADYRFLMRDLFLQEGHEVLLAENGEEGLEKLKNHPIDLIVTDIYMPVMDGFKLHRVIRSTPKWEKLPIVFVSAYDDQHSVDVVQDPTIETFLRKGRPFSDIKKRMTQLTISKR